MEAKSISQATDEALKYIIDRKEGNIKPLKTKWDKLNNILGGGLEWNTIIGICGMSSSGKTLLLNELEDSLFNNNPDEDFISINLNYEMMSRMLIIRKLSAKTNLTIKDILSVGNTMLSDVDIDDFKREIDVINKHPIYFYESPSTIKGIAEIIDYNWKLHKKKIVLFLDHTILVRKSSTDSNTIDLLYNLMDMFNHAKKNYPIIIVISSQLNREIESTERIQRPSSLNYPKKGDIFGSESLFQMSDIVIVNHRPSQLNMKFYGEDRTPVTERDLFWHILKNRNGELAILRMIAEFKHMKIEEYV